MEDGSNFDDLGFQWRRSGSKVKVHMDTYIDELERVEVEGKADQLANTKQIAMARRLLAQLRWPISHEILELAYDISKMAPSSYEKWSIAEVRSLNDMVGRVTSAKKMGRAWLVLSKHNCEKLAVATSFDANFSRQVGMSSQRGLLSFISDGAIQTAESVCSQVEFGSSVLHRVVRSTFGGGSGSVVYGFGQTAVPEARVGIDPAWSATMWAGLAS